MSNRIIPVLTITLTLMVLASCSSSKSNIIRITNGNLLPCPSSPNCVSSQAEDTKHKIEPIAFPASKKTVIYSIIIEALNDIGRVEIMTNTPEHIHAVFKTKIFRFKDDLDLFIDQTNNQIHVRSASRTGHSDFGVNRKRVETLRRIITKTAI